MASEYQRVRDYELMVVFHPDLSEEDFGTQVSAVEGMITGQGGEIRLINHELPWGRRRLAYPIRHGSRDLRDGIYVLYYFTSVSTALFEIERDIKLDDQVIRYLLTQQGAPMMEPQPEEEEAAEGETTEGEEASEGEAATRPGKAAPVEEAAAEAPVKEAAAEAPVEEAAAEVPVEEAAAEAPVEVAAAEAPVEVAAAEAPVEEAAAEEVVAETEDETTA